MCVFVCRQVIDDRLKQHTLRAALAGTAVMVRWSDNFNNKTVFRWLFLKHLT